MAERTPLMDRMASQRESAVVVIRARTRNAISAVKAAPAKAAKKYNDNAILKAGINMVISFVIGFAILAVSLLVTHFGKDHRNDTKYIFDHQFWGFPDKDEGEDVIKNIYAGLMLGLVFGFLDNFGLFISGPLFDALFNDIAERFVKDVIIYDKATKDQYTRDENFERKLELVAAAAQDEYKKQIWKACKGKVFDPQVLPVLDKNKFDDFLKDEKKTITFDFTITHDKTAEDFLAIPEESCHDTPTEGFLAIPEESCHAKRIKNRIENRHKTEVSISNDYVKKNRMQENMLGGLGNTFSDALGVLIGGACLAIAKAGLNVDPGFWIMDVFSMILGCLLGVFLPAILFNGAIVESRWFTAAGIGLISLVMAVILTGIPHGDGDPGLISSVVFLFIAFLVFLALVCNMVFSKRAGGISRWKVGWTLISTMVIVVMVLIFILPFALK